MTKTENITASNLTEGDVFTHPMSGVEMMVTKRDRRVNGFVSLQYADVNFVEGWTNLSPSAVIEVTRGL